MYLFCRHSHSTSPWRKPGPQAFEDAADSPFDVERSKPMKDLQIQHCLRNKKSLQNCLRLPRKQKELAKLLCFVLGGHETGRLKWAS